MNHLAEAEYRFACLVWGTEPLPTAASWSNFPPARAGLEKKHHLYRAEKAVRARYSAKRGRHCDQPGKKGGSAVRRASPPWWTSAALARAALPRCVAAFLNSKPISAAEAAEIRALLDAAQSKEG